MEIIKIENKNQIKNYLSFIKKLYSGDENYVCTAKFNAETILYRKTNFIKNCCIHPIAVIDDGKIYTVCTFIVSPSLPMLQIGLFESMNNPLAVELVIEEAKRIAGEKNLTKIVIGLNGHLSYGVGILESGFDGKITFDSIYNKPYYKDLFAPHITCKQQLYTFRATTNCLRERLDKLKRPKNTEIRTMKTKNFPHEVEIMRQICEKTIAKTFLFERTEKLHFEQLMGDLLPFLRPENLLFSVKNGCENGFLFWHPDYNDMLDGGRDYNLLQMFFKVKNANKHAKTMKFNAIGVEDGDFFALTNLVFAVASHSSDNYKFAETNFVWGNNEKSLKICRHLFGEAAREYAVYFIERWDSK